LRVAQELKAVFAEWGEDLRDHAIAIENEAGKVVLSATFDEVFAR